MRKELIIFGAEGSLGKGVTRELLSDNYDQIYLVNRQFNHFNTEKNIILIECSDLTSEESVKNVFNQITADKNKAFFLFSTVGGFAGGQSIDETDYDTWKKMIDLNLNTSFLIAKYFIKLIKASNSGTAVFTSALAASKNGINNSAYTVSKNALNFFIKNLALEGKKYNLSTNAISPYVIDTPENREWVEDTTIMAAPEAIAGTVKSLFDNYRNISGSIVHIPGTFHVG